MLIKRFTKGTLLHSIYILFSLSLIGCFSGIEAKKAENSEEASLLNFAADSSLNLESKGTCTEEKYVNGTDADDFLVGCDSTYSMIGKGGKDIFQFQQKNVIKLGDFSIDEDILDLRFLESADLPQPGETLKDLVQVLPGRFYYILKVRENGVFRKKAHFGNYRVSGSAVLTLDQLGPRILMNGFLPSDDSSTDTGSTDTGSTDTGSTDTGSTDTGSTDTGSTDTGSHDHDMPTGDPGTIGDTSDPSKACGQLMMSHDGHTSPHVTDPAKAQEHMEAMNLLTAANATNTAAKNGYWSAASTWVGGKIPAANADIYIPAGICVVYDLNSNTKLHYLRADGGLAFSKSQNTKMIVDTIIASHTSAFVMGTSGHPIQNDVKAEIIIADNGDISLTTDPLQLSRGLILHGLTEIHGKKKKSYLELASNPGQGATSIQVNGSTSNWKVGDTLVIVGTQFGGDKRYGAGNSQDEVRKIKAISGQIISLDSALKYNHNVYPGHNFKNYVGNQTRNVVIRSENPSGVRGHFMIMHSPYAKVRYAEFAQLGRTDKRLPISAKNPTGRYSIHFHRTGAKANGQMAIAEGNSVVQNPGWGIVHHDSFAAVNHNFVFDVVGAGIVSEVGTEIGEWVGNLVTSVKGAGLSGTGRDLLPLHGAGYLGEAYSNMSRAVIQVGNIAANSHTGWSFEGRIGPLSNNISGGYAPKKEDFKYDPIPMGGYNSDPDIVQFIRFENNQAYVIDQSAIISTHRAGPGEETDTLNEVLGFKAWNVGVGFNFRNYTWDYVFRDSIVVGKDNGIGAGAEFWHKTHGMTFVNTHIENFKVGINYELLNYKGVLSKVTFKNCKQNIGDGSGTVNLKDGGSYYAQAIPMTTVNYDSVVEKGASLKITSPSSLVLTPRVSTMYLSGVVTDSFGNYEFGTVEKWVSPQVYTKPSVYSDLKVVFRDSGSDTDLGVLNVIKNNGTIYRDGKWLMPVTFWLGDRFSGHNYPNTIYFELSGFDPAFLQENQRVNYSEPNKSTKDDIQLYSDHSNY